MLGQAYRLAVAAFNERRLDEAARLCGITLASDPDAFEPNYLLALTRSRAGDPEAALANYSRALAARPDHAEARCNHGNALLKVGRFEEALVECDRAIALRPQFVEAHLNRARVLANLRRFEDAARSAGKAQKLRPDSPEAAIVLADAMLALNRTADAEACIRRVVGRRPGDTAALRMLCRLLLQMERHHEAAAALVDLLKLPGPHPHVLGELVNIRMGCCDWKGLADLPRDLLDAVRFRGGVVAPFFLFNQPATPADHLINARRHHQASYRAVVQHPQDPYRKRAARERIRLAYLSADFGMHPVSDLAVGMFEQHDRVGFEVIAVSLSQDDGSPIRRRLEQAFDRFIDVGALSDREIADILAEEEIDIAIDLMGYTTAARPRILAHRPAPIQVSYLGFPGTMGAPWIDYILADRHVIPDDERAFFDEQVVHLPDTYLASDDRRPISDAPQTRAMHALDEQALVFCCFCGSYKIAPDVFAVWMRLLARVPGSVLWLRWANEAAVSNLREAAASHGVDPDRLVFSSPLPMAEHLARHRLADLALDTLPFNGHTTTSDALWAGVPVLTCTGTTFPGRVATSLLHAVGMPELVTHTARDYEALALQLATDRSSLRRMRDKLARNRLTMPAFDTARLCRHIEAAYREMWDIHRRGDRPRSIRVAPLAKPGAEPDWPSSGESG